MIDTYVKIGGQYQPAVLKLATQAERSHLEAWVTDYEADATDATNDIREYVDSALDKQEKYAALGRCPANWPGFLAQARRAGEEETAGLFVLTCLQTGQELLGFTFLRRNWDKSLVMDYLARCPASNPRLRDVEAIGIGLLLAICKVAQALDAPYFWWETTPLSAGYYRKVLHRAAAEPRTAEPASLLIIDQPAYLRLLAYLEPQPNPTSHEY